MFVFKTQTEEFTDLLSPNNRRVVFGRELQRLSGSIHSCSSRAIYTQILRIMSRHPAVLSLFKDGDSTICLGKLCQCSLIHTITRCLLMFIRNFLCFSLLPLTQILSLGTTENGLILSHFCPAFRYLHTVKRSLQRPLFSRLDSPNSFSLSSFGKHFRTTPCWLFAVSVCPCPSSAEEPRTGHCHTSAEQKGISHPSIFWHLLFMHLMTPSAFFATRLYY